MLDYRHPIAHLRRGGTSIVVDLRDGRLPRIVHWGADLGAVDDAMTIALADAVRPTLGDSAISYPQPVPVVPQLAEGWLGRPGIAGSRNGAAFAPRFGDASSTLVRGPTTETLCTHALDPQSQLAITVDLRLTNSGLVQLAAELTNIGQSPYRVDVFEPALPLPDIAGEILDFTGRWAHERIPQRHTFPIGAWTRESRGGRPGLDHSTLMAVGEPGFGFRSGRVWAAHLAWSGNQAIVAERTPAGTRSLRAGEILLPDEVVLEPGDSYRTPWLIGSWGDGLDELSARFHRFLRARPSHPSSPRPVLVNTWEAVYFQHEFKSLAALAERSAELGAERFVIDDGWFLGRRDDTSSLGDWIVDPEIWPDGLEAIAARVHALGMQFGLWFEPEMVSLNSSLAREHPEWLFDAGHGPGLPSRHQYVLDLAHDGAYALVLERISSLVERVGIDYIKWDHNRPLTDAGHSANGRPGVHTQTVRAYRMMDELRARHSGLEIESCASGGGRIDLGVLERTDRVWPSDCNDPHDRIDIQRFTSLLLPPELLGTHIGAEESHTTHRVAPLDFRAATAFWGNLGVELRLTTLDEATFARLRAWVVAHRAMRQLLHSGDVVHADTHPAIRLEGVVSSDRRVALFQFAVLDRPAVWPPPRLRFPGLDPDALYDVTEFSPGDPVPPNQRPPWMATPLRLSGRILSEVGLEPPSLDPDRSVLLRLEQFDVAAAG